MKVEQVSEFESPPTCHLYGRELDFTDGKAMEMDVYRTAHEKVEWDWEREWRENQTFLFCADEHASRYFAESPFPQEWAKIGEWEGGDEFDWGALGCFLFIFVAAGCMGLGFFVAIEWIVTSLL